MENEEKAALQRAGLTAVAGAIPFVGGVLAALSAYWGEKHHRAAVNLLERWVQDLQDELREKGQTIAEVVARLDMEDERVKERVESDEYQRLLKKTFRRWSAIDSEAKRQKVRNILGNAAASRLVSDDVVSLFIDWIAAYSDFHFEVIGAVYQQREVTRGGIWQALGKPVAREDSAEADLFRLLVDDLSQGRVIRQVRQTDAHGRFLKAQPKRTPKGQASKTMKSAFATDKAYHLTELGNQFVHYAMNELAPRLTFEEQPVDD